jgi:Domain of unknown function (DUF5615)
MLRFLSDEDFDNRIVRGLLECHPELEVVRAQDVGLSGQDDAVVLEWAARERRILLTHDASTMTKYAYERVRAGLPMQGVLEVSQSYPIGQAVEQIWLAAECSEESEWEGRVRYPPL